jgi:hypothetical protein
VIHQFIQQSVLSAKNEGDEGFRIEVKLQQRVELGKDLDAHEVGFIDDQDRLLFSGGDFGEKTPEGLGEEGDGKGTRLHLEGEQDLLEEFEDGAGVGGDGNDPVLRGVKRRRGVAQGGGFPCTHLSGDDTHSAQFEGIEESVREGLEARQGIEVFDLDILREGFSLKAEEVLIASHRLASFRRAFHPDRMLQSEVQGENSVGVRGGCAPRFF